MARGTGSFRRGNGRGGSRFGYRGNTSFRGGRGRGRGRGGAPSDAPPQRDEDGNQLEERFEQVKTSDEVDEKLGFARVQEGSTREGWLINMHPVRDSLLCLYAGDGTTAWWNDDSLAVCLLPERREGRNVV